MDTILMHRKANFVVFDVYFSDFCWDSGQTLSSDLYLSNHLSQEFYDAFVNKNSFCLFV